MTLLVYILLVSIAVLGVFLIGWHQKLLTLQKMLATQFLALSEELRRRYDLIPNLVQTGHKNEWVDLKQTEKILSARNYAMGVHQKAIQNPSSAEEIRRLVAAERGLNEQLSKLFEPRVTDAPTSTDPLFRRLTSELNETQRRIGDRSKIYNSTVFSYNHTTQKFPHRLIAKNYNFPMAERFDLQIAKYDT